MGDGRPGTADLAGPCPSGPVPTGPGPGLADDVLRGGVVLPAAHVGALAGFQFLVDVEEVADLVEQVAGHVAQERRRSAYRGSWAGTASTFASGPFSSVSQNTSTGRAVTAQPGERPASPSSTITSTGSPSSASVPAMNP